MHLIAPLAVGMRGARNGTVFAYLRGTATPAPVWADASGKLRRHGALRLDKLGQISLYVDQLVDILVYDSTMLLVRRWTDGRSAGAVVVEHPAFTGVDFETGVSGVGERTTLVEALGRWLPSAGAPDWNVISDGEALPVGDVIGDAAGVFFDPREFGATGDGAGDDWAPIQAAIEVARQAGGGIVYLVSGTYRIGSALALHESVSIEGAGSVTLISSSAIDSVMDIFGSLPSSPKHRVAGLNFASEVNRPVELVHVQSGSVVIDKCTFNGNLLTGPLLTVNENATCVVDSSFFTIVGPTSTAIDAADAVNDVVGKLSVFDCSFSTPPAYSGSVVKATRFHIDGCRMDMVATVAGPVTCVDASGTIMGNVDGCEHYSLAGTPYVGLSTGALETGDYIFEDCSVHNASGAAFSLYLTGDSGTLPIGAYYSRLKTVDARLAPPVNDATLNNSNLTHFIVPDASQYGVYAVSSIDNAADTGVDSTVVIGSATTTTYSNNINLGRAIDIIFSSRQVEAYRTGNTFRSSAIPTFLFRINTVLPLRMMAARVVSAAAGGEVSRLYCIAAGATPATLDPTVLEGYGPIV